TSLVFIDRISFHSVEMGESWFFNAYRQRRRHSSCANFARSSHSRFSHRRNPRHSSLRRRYTSLHRSLQRLARAAPDAVLGVTSAPKQINRVATKLKQKFDRFILSISSVFAPHQ